MNKERPLVKQQSPDTELEEQLKFKQTLADNLEVALSALSAKNRYEYEATFRNWSEYIGQLGLDAYHFELMRVRDYLIENDWSFNTRKTRLAHLKKFAEILAKSDRHNRHDFAHNFGRLTLLKPKSLGGAKNVAVHRALKPKQIYKLFDSLVGDSNQKTRDRAILGLLLLAGLRASEVVSLKWTNVDYHKNLLYIFEGKGDKSAHIPMLGDLAQILRDWHYKQAESGIFDFICCQIFRSDNLGSDNQMTTRIINSCIKRLVADTGIKFTPHDTRRTAITTLLEAGASVPQVRDFSRHSSGETTLRYAQETDAIALGSLLEGKLKYGGVLGDMKPSEQSRYFECDNGHKFQSTDAKTCPKCGSENITHQTSLFD